MNWELVVGVSSVVIASCALFISIWQTNQSRKHNIISCRPHLTTGTHNKSAQGIYALNLMNNGLGPALIKSFTIKVDGKLVSGEGTDAIDKALKIIFPDEKIYAEYSSLGKNYAMSPKDSCKVFALKFLAENPPSSEFVEQAINRGDLEVEYESFHSEKFFFSTVDEQPQKGLSSV